MAEVSKTCFVTAENIRKLLSNVGVTSEIEWENILKELQTATELLKDELNRELMPETLYTDVLEVLRIGHRNLQDELTDNRNSYLSLTECYRTLRNACAACPKNQQLIYRDSEAGILTTTLSLCKLLTSQSSTDCVSVLCCAVQFLGNLSVGDTNCQRKIWSMFITVFSDLVTSEEKKLPHYTCMVIHTCLSGLCQHKDDVAMVTEFLSTNENGRNLIMNILDAFGNNSSEFMLYVIEDILKLNGVWKSLSLNKKHKQLLLEIAGKRLSEGGNHGDDLSLPVSSDNLESIAEDFITSAHSMLDMSKDTGSGDDEVTGLVIMKELEVICLATSDPSKYEQLRNNQKLLTTSISLLHSVKALGKTGENIFTNKKKPEAQHIHEQHPVYGLKRDIIRLIGNLSYRNTANQNLVRELDGLPLVLDHTSIDNRNPFITQWSVFAVRNLCERNPENQAVLANLKREGMADNVDMLRDFGIQAELKDDKIVVKPTPKS